jgi:membrane-anchored glycerophosphoryl diester phosphodiesterase (GDPDase)
MFGVVFFILLLLFGWWLIRATRSLDRLATIVNENDVELGFKSIKGKTSALMLFADVRFVLWLVRRKYQSIDAPPVVTQALDDARRDYFIVTSVMALIVITGFAIALNNRLG